MTQPRRILDGATYLITRRALRRYCLFAPDPRITQLFVFALAWCAQTFGVEVHAAILMSTHEHLIVTDIYGVLPMFLQMFHRLVALATKVVRKWEGAVWDHEPPSVVELVTPEAVIQETAYLIANPTAAGLVERACDWPGMTTLIEQLAGGVLEADRPTFFFAASNSQWGERASVTLTLPRMLDGAYTPESFRAAVATEVERLEREAHAKQQERPERAADSEQREEEGDAEQRDDQLEARAKRREQLDVEQRDEPAPMHREQVDASPRKTRRAFAGPERCMRVSPYQRMKGYEEIRGRNPVLAAGRGQTALRLEAIRVLRAFRAAYREALDRWRTGHRDVAFPAGTWMMQRLHAANVAHDLATAA
ncbi:MAG: transposase [Myxococcota bacterium]|nr:transposase [Myxococcota bacterium]